MDRRVVAALVVMLAAAPALARTTRASDARERAAVHWKSGSARYAAGEWLAALDDFEAGYAAHPSPPFLVNIGQCLRKLDRLDEAALAFRRFLDTRTGSARTRLDVYDALEDVTADLNRRVDSLAESAALFGAYLRAGDSDPALRARVSAAREEILRTLVAIDDNLTRGYGVARALALPRPGAAVASHDAAVAGHNAAVAVHDAGVVTPEAGVARVRQRLAAMAATRSPMATTTRRRSPRSISHSHIRR